MRSQTILAMASIGIARMAPGTPHIQYQNTTARIAKNGHSNVYAQLRGFPDSARRSCQSPSHSMPATEATMNRCQATHLGAITNRQRDHPCVPGMAPSLAAPRRAVAPREAGPRLGIVLMATLLGMALGGWMSGMIFDFTGSYRAAFLNGLFWNLLHVTIVLWLVLRPGTRLAPT